MSKTDGESLAGLTGFFQSAACFSVAAVCERIIQEDVTRTACVGEQVAKQINTDDANDSRQQGSWTVERCRRYSLMGFKHCDLVKKKTSLVKHKTTTENMNSTFTEFALIIHVFWSCFLNKLFI